MEKKTIHSFIHSFIESYCDWEIQLLVVLVNVKFWHSLLAFTIDSLIKHRFELLVISSWRSVVHLIVMGHGQWNNFWLCYQSTLLFSHCNVSLFLDFLFTSDVIADNNSCLCVIFLQTILRMLDNCTIQPDDVCLLFCLLFPGFLWLS